MAYRERSDVPDELHDQHPGSTWLLWPNARRGPWLLRLQWTRIAGRLECCGLEIRSFRETSEQWPSALPTWDENPEILTTTELRKLPLGRILQDLREEGWRRTEEMASSIEAEPADDESREIAAGLRRQGRVDRARHRGVPPLAEVAAIYRTALEQRKAPTQEVADHWGVAHSTAAKWVMRARGEGHLPPAPRSRPKRKETLGE